MWDLIVSVSDHCLSFYFTYVTTFHVYAFMKIPSKLKMWIPCLGWEERGKFYFCYLCAMIISFSLLTWIYKL